MSQFRGVFIFFTVFAMSLATEDWQSRVDKDLVGSGKISKAAIVKLSGELLAKSKDFQLSEAEAGQATMPFRHVFIEAFSFGGQFYRTDGIPEDGTVVAHLANETVLVTSFNVIISVVGPTAKPSEALQVATTLARSLKSEE